MALRWRNSIIPLFFLRNQLKGQLNMLLQLAFIRRKRKCSSFETKKERKVEYCLPEVGFEVLRF